MKINLSEKVVKYLEKKGIKKRKKVEECINGILSSWIDAKMSREEMEIINSISEK